VGLIGLVGANNTVLVTGGAGYIGSHVLLSLLDAGFEVVTIDNLSTGRRLSVPDEVAFYEGDIANAALLDKIWTEHEISAVMNFAGSIKVGESIERPLLYYRNNVLGSQALLEACSRHDVSEFIFSSSAAVYGVPDQIPVSETAPTEPINPYGRTKLITEWQLADLSAVTGMRYATLRYFNVAGADPAMRTGESVPSPSHLIKIAAQVATGRRSGMRIFGDDYETPDGTCIRDYIHVSDLADLHVIALQHLRRSGENFTTNCGYGHGLSNREVMAAVAKVIDAPFDIEFGPRRPGDPAILVSDVRKLHSLFRWTPKYDNIETIISTAIEWEKRLKAEED
jgi:UDP-glucose 4-epimerase